MSETFAPEVVKKLNWYVYRLIDPRNGETFYVGKGKGNRIFDHGKGALKDNEARSLKNERIRSIDLAGLKVGHVIHVHNIDDEQIALQIEAALIDAYPGLTNEVGGHGSGDYGCRHVDQIIAQYAAEPFVAREKLILISIAKSYEEIGIDKAVRAAWRLNKNKAEGYGLILAHCQGVVVGAFRPTKWSIATKENFPWLSQDFNDRFGFEGHEAGPEIKALYVQKRVPDLLRRKGAANPIRFVSEIGLVEDQETDNSN